jgi:cell division septum initiation protein DivIVA
MPGKRVAIDEHQFLDLIDQMRITIPAEIKQAREIQEERDHYVAQAQEEARQMLAQARDEATRLLDDHKLRLVAEGQAETIKKRAESDARRVREGADEYAETRLRDMHETLAELLKVVQNGLDELSRRRADQRAAEAAPPAPEPTPPAPAGEEHRADQAI